MKILHVDSGRDWRGGQAQVLLLTRGLRDRGHEQLLCCPSGSPLGERAAGFGLSVEPVGIRGDLDAGAFLGLSRLCRRFRPDVLHAHTSHAHAVGVAAARLSGVPARVVTRRSALPGSRPALSRAKYRSGVTRYIAISRHVADTLVRSGVDPGRISVVYSGVPPGRPPEGGRRDLRAKAREAMGLPPGGIVLGVIGALTAEKGHETAVAALAKMRSAAHLVLVGDGPLRERIEARVARLQLEDRVVLAGFRPDLGDLWPAFDLVLAPSRHEGLGTSVVEALGAGVPAVVSSAGGLVEIVEGGRGGVTVTSEDPAAWARAADDLLNDQEARRRLSLEGIRRAQDFTPERMIRGTEEVYENVFRGRTTGIGRRVGFLEAGS